MMNDEKACQECVREKWIGACPHRSFLDGFADETRAKVNEHMNKHEEYKEKAEAYDKLVELLHLKVEALERGETLPKGWDHLCFFVADEIRKLLPPRPPKYEEVPWWQAIEGLKSGKYRRAQPCSTQHDWCLWRLGLVDDDGDVYDLDVLGTWRAELA